MSKSGAWFDVWNMKRTPVQMKGLQMPLMSTQVVMNYPMTFVSHRGAVVQLELCHHLARG